MSNHPRASLWKLRRDLTFLNHGSFGAVPRTVHEKQRELQDALESDPIRFLAPERDLEPKLDHVRQRVAELVRCVSADLAFVRNATYGVNAVVGSFPLQAGDEIVVTNQGYNACSNAARFACSRVGAVMRTAEVPFPLERAEQVVEAIEAAFTERTRLLLVDHVTSPTGLIFPVEAIVQLAHDRGVRVLVDGAHAPGMLPLNLERLAADYYTGNHHKWLCAPKTSGFLHVREGWQDEVRPAVVSHALNRPRPGRSVFLSQFDWCGTYDPTPLLTVPHAIDFLASLSPQGLEGTMEGNRRLALASRRLLCETLEIPLPSPDEMIGSLVAVPLPGRTTASLNVELDELQRLLYDQHQIELPIYQGPTPESRLLRISLQAYNDIDQVRRLCELLKQYL